MSPYVQVTTRCNMQCLHCCYSCTTRGKDMSLEVFEAALKLDEESMSIGGGEPTVHPLFWQFFGLAIAHVEYVWMATNGKETKTALSLARLAKKGVLSVELSQDEWHEKVDPRVVEAFTRPLHQHPSYSSGHDDLRGIRSVQAVSNAGRAKKNQIATDFEGCCCEDLFIRPDGSIHQCGCPNSPRLGHVLEEFDRNLFVNEDGEIPCCRKGKVKAVAVA